MGGSESDTPTKATKAPPAGPQEQPPANNSTAATPTTPTVYPDWSGFQAYSPIPPPGFFHTSPQAHPYMWPPQHLLPPYGTPPAPYVMYPHGVYAHPPIAPGSHPFSPYTLPTPNGNAEASGVVAGGVEVDGKSSDGKEKGPIKRSKGSLGSLNMITGKNNNEPGKTCGASANGVSQSIISSGESGSEGSSEGSEANSQNDSQPKTPGGQDSYDGVSPNGTAAHGSQNGVTHPSSQAVLSHPMPIMPLPAAGAPAGVGGPTTTLNIGMDYWGAPTPSSIPPVRGKVPAAAVAGAMIPGGIAGSRENMPSGLWLQDERELKRQRRKQSNRESARRSRLRKQAECEELAQRVEVLKEENAALRAEVDRIRKEHDQLLAQNSSLKERLGGTPKGTEDGIPERNDQHSGDGTHRSLDSNAQAEQ